LFGTTGQATYIT